MPDYLAGSTITALDTPRAESDTQGSTVTTTSTTLTTSGADCAVTFVAPTTGRVKIHSAARMINSSTSSGAITGPETRTGGVIGSGTIVEAASAANGPSHYGNTFASIGRTHLLEGLTPGSTYNTRMLMQTSVGTDTATFANREIMVEPAT